MFDSKSDKWLTTLTSFSGLTIMITLVLFWELARVWFLLLTLFSIGYFLKNRPRLCKDQIIFCLPIVVFFITAFLSFLVNDSPKRGPQILLETFLLLVSAIPLLFLYTRHAPSLRMVWTMFIAAAMAAGFIAIADVGFTPNARAGGSTGQPILFATLALAMTGAASASYRFWSKYRPWGRVVFIASIGLGIAAVLLSGARGAWLAMPFLGLIMLLFYLENFSWYRKSAAILIFLVALPLLGYQIPLIKNRVDLALDEASVLIVENQESINYKTTSLGVRLELWRAAIDIFSENIIFGVGPGSYKMAMKQYVSENNVSERLPYFKHAHNQYLNTLMTKGLIGAFALVFMLVAHLYLFIKYLKKSNPPDIRALAIAACCVIPTFLLIGLTSSPLERKITLVLYVISLVVLLGKIISLNQETASVSLRSDAHTADPEIVASDV